MTNTTPKKYIIKTPTTQSGRRAGFAFVANTKNYSWTGRSSAAKHFTKPEAADMVATIKGLAPEANLIISPARGGFLWFQP